MFFFPCALAVLIVWLNSRERLARYRMQSDLYTQTLEKEGHSVTLPDGLFAEPEKKRGDGSLKAGLICIAAGVAVALGFWLVSIVAVRVDDDMSVAMQMLAVIGIVPFMIGVAFMIIHFFEKKRDAVGKAE